MLNPKGNLETQEKGCWKVVHKNIDIDPWMLWIHTFFSSNTYFYFSPFIKFTWILSSISTFFSNIWERTYILKNRVEKKGLTLLALAGLSCWYCAISQKVFSTRHFYNSSQTDPAERSISFLKQTQPRQYVLTLPEIESNFIIDFSKRLSHWSLYQGSFIELSSIPQPLFIQHWDVGGIKMSKTSLDACP